jgi:hypothetical protein
MLYILYIYNRYSKMEERTIWLEGGVLWIDDLIFWDANVFRPSLKETMDFSRKSKAYIRFDWERLQGNELVKYPKIIVVDNTVFTNIR